MFFVDCHIWENFLKSCWMMCGGHNQTNILYTKHLRPGYAHRKHTPEILENRNSIMLSLKHRNIGVFQRPNMYKYNFQFSEIDFDIQNNYPKCARFSHSYQMPNFPIQQNGNEGSFNLILLLPWQLQLYFPRTVS